MCFRAVPLRGVMHFGWLEKRHDAKNHESQTVKKRHKLKLYELYFSDFGVKGAEIGG